MTRILTLETNIGLVSIKLLDTDFVDFWLSHFKKVIAKYELTMIYVTWPYVNKEANNQLINQKIDTMLAAVNEINTTEYLSVLPDIITRDQLLKLTLETQEVLNRLHRCAVTGAALRDRWLYHKESTFAWVPWEDDRYAYILNVLNQGIHALEEHVYTPHKNQFDGWIQHISINIDASKYNDVNVYQDDVDLEIPSSMQTCLRLSGHDVWIKKDILGKDFITAFVDHDDPDEFDVRPPPWITGGIQIDLPNNRRDALVNSSEFIEWLGCTPTNHHGNYPLGDIIDGKENIIDAVSIKFHSITN